MRQSFERIVQISAVVIAFCAVTYTVVLSLEVPLTGDHVLFMAVGRAVINNLELWDVFETKPPLIFWISALSLSVTGDDTLYKLLLGGGLAGMVALLTWAADAKDRTVVFCMGCAVSLWILWLSLGFETEAFAAFPATLALVCFRKRWWISALCFGFLGLLKEPFTVTLVMGFLLLARDKKDLIRIVYISLLGGLAALLVLTVTGNIHDYFTVYLPEMLSARIEDAARYHHYGKDVVFTAESSSLMRGFFFRKTLEGLSEYASLFGLTILAYLAAYIRERRIVSLLCIAMLCLAGDLFYILYQIIAAVGYIPWNDAFFQGKVALLAFYSCGALLFPWTDRERTALVLLSLYVITLCAGIGSFTLPHLIFGLPVFIALMLSGEIDRRWLPVVALSTIPFVFLFQLATAYTEERVRESLLQERGQVIDEVLDACGIERYMIADPALADVAAFTRHSPFEISYGLNHFDLTEEWAKTEIAVSLGVLQREGFIERSGCAERRGDLRFFFRK